MQKGCRPINWNHRMTLKIRASQTSGWNDCPRRGASRSYRDMITDAGFELNDYAFMVRFVSSTIGTSCHEGAKFALQNKLEGKQFSLDDMTDISINYFNEAKESGLAYDTITGKPSDADIQIQNIMRSYYHFLLPNINPIAVEFEMEAEMQDGTIITAHADVIETISIRDLKTGKSPDDYHSQLGTYSILAKTNGICNPKKLLVDWIPRTAVSKNYEEPKSLLFNVEICEEEAKQTIKSIVSQVNNFTESKSPSAFPANTNSILCSEKFCPAYATDFCKLKEKKE